MWRVFLHQRWIGQKMESYLIPRTCSRLIEWVMKTLVNTHAALRTVKGKWKQLFRLQLQVNVDFLFSSCCSCQFLFFFFTLTPFFALYFLIPSQGPPEINPQLKNQSVTYNSPLQLNCSVSGFPTPEVFWAKDGEDLGKENTLIIHQVRFKDSGRYTCSAKNREGSKKSTFWIKVTGSMSLIYI